MKKRTKKSSISLFIAFHLICYLFSLSVLAYVQRSEDSLGRFSWVGSPLLPCGSRGSNSALQVWWASVPDNPCESGSHVVAQTDLKPTVLLPQSSESWDDRPHYTWLLAIFILTTAKKVGGEKKLRRKNQK